MNRLPAVSGALPTATTSLSAAGGCAPPPPFPLKTKKRKRCSNKDIPFRNVAGPAGPLNDERLLNRSLSKDNLGIGLLSHVKMRSIMGDEALNFRVRNGIGCTRFSMDTKEIFQIYN